MQLTWDINKQYGFLDIIPRKYDEAYFNKYEQYANTELGKQITESRISFVNRNHTGKLLDVGVGCGAFVKERINTFGYDINESAINELKRIGRYIDIYDRVFPAYSFFDSFEHIKDPSFLLRNMYPKTKVFISIPIFRDIRHALQSKHFRIDEHYWYFTTQGLIRYMLDHSFICIDIDNFETRLGREDILSFAFERI